MWPNGHRKAIKDWLSGPVLLHYSLPIIMAYLIAGTIAQKYIGLYESTQIFFSAPIIWLGYIPLPGFPILMAIMSLNLLAKLIWKSSWSARNSGIIITHLSVLCLLIGGLITALFSQEGYLELEQNRMRAHVTDYHQRSLMIEGDQLEGAIHLDFATLHAGQIINQETLPFTIHILERCQNCEIKARHIADNDPYQDHYQSMAKHMTLVSAPLKQTNETNMGGTTLAIRDKETNAIIGVFTALEDVPKWPEFKSSDQDHFTIKLHKKIRDLPFTVELLEFKRETHAGMMLAKAYQSRVKITDKTGSWESLIRMNEPLRYKGYTLFQSSFIQTDQGEISVLAIVKNAGRSFPYIASLLLCLGLMVHLFIRKQEK